MVERDWVSWEAQQRTALEQLPGGPDVIAYLGFVPSFHDAEIVRLDLRRDEPSLISVQTWKADSSDRSVVDITIGTVVDLMLEGFSRQNVVFEIGFQLSAPPREDRVGMYFATGRLSEEIEITLGDTYGVSGVIHCLDVSLSVRPLRSPE